MLFQGSATALVTPFHSDFSVNREKFIELIERQIAGGTQALVINGTTGEASTLSKQERLECLTLALQVVNKRIPVIAGTGSNNTAEALAATLEAEQAGADGAMLVTPYYNKTSQAGIIAHYTHIADQTKLPLLIYVVPGRTGQQVTVDTMVELAKHPQIVGLKDATGDVVYMMDILRKVSRPFAVYSGNDDVVLPYMVAGASGVISTVANLFPAPMQQLCEAVCQGNIEQARKIQYDLLPVIQNVFSEVNPIGTKGGLNALGLEVGVPRLPLVSMGAETYQKLATAVAHYTAQ